jgi:hypothetical protein
MTYELAKQLKEAEFPEVFVPMGLMMVKNIVNPDDDPKYYAPTLSELIEACGDSFYCVIRGRGTMEGVWIASQMTSPEFNLNKTSQGSTPEEAVAKLWLELNKKDGGEPIK